MNRDYCHRFRLIVFTINLDIISNKMQIIKHEFMHKFTVIVWFFLISIQIKRFYDQSACRATRIFQKWSWNDAGNVELQIIAHNLFMWMSNLFMWLYEDLFTVTFAMISYKIATTGRVVAVLSSPKNFFCILCGNPLVYVQGININFM